jgi:hypothetical protein
MPPAAGATVLVLLLQVRLRKRVDVADPVLFTMQQSLWVGGARRRWCACSYYVPVCLLPGVGSLLLPCFLCAPKTSRQPAASRQATGREEDAPVL